MCNMTVDMIKRYEAAMVLSGVGDALGYKKGEWEICRDGEEIHEELKKLGGLNSITVCPENWPVSDDTVMHIATAKALVHESPGEPKEQLYVRLAREYKDCMRLMSGKSPGNTCVASAEILDPDKPGGYIIPFNRQGGGCGAAMRAMCIGLRYPNPNDLPDLIRVSIESGRITHHHPTGYLGALAMALFTSFAVQGRPLVSWGRELLNTLPAALEHVQQADIQVEENVNAWEYFEREWKRYLEHRKISDGVSKPWFPEPYDVAERDQFYLSRSRYGFCGGRSGHDAPMVAYDALLGFNGTWKDFCARAMFHGGDNDSTGAMAGSLYGAMFGFKGVRKCNYRNLEFREVLTSLAHDLYKLSHGKDDFEAQMSRKKCSVQ